MKKIIIILIILISKDLFAKDIWIYSDDGTWQDGIIALEQFFDYHDISHKRVYAMDLNNSNNYEDAYAICFPGGYAYNYKIALTFKTINNIRDYVANGGSYIGVCAGAFFASSDVVWEGEYYPYSLSLFKGKAIGSIYEIAPWDNYKMTNISINKDNDILRNPPVDLKVLYYGGPYFQSDETDFDTIATWDEFHNFPSIINFNYVQGKVLLIGPHLEIEEDDDRDFTNFALELKDIESDWDFLSIIVDWVLGNNTSVMNNRDLNQSMISPNPATDYIEISTSSQEGAGDVREIKIYNTMGECVINHEFKITNYKNLRIDISHLQIGVYFIKIENYTGKFMVVR